MEAAFHFQITSRMSEQLYFNEWLNSYLIPLVSIRCNVVAVPHIRRMKSSSLAKQEVMRDSQSVQRLVERLESRCKSRNIPGVKTEECYGRVQEAGEFAPQIEIRCAKNLPEFPRMISSNSQALVPTKINLALHHSERCIRMTELRLPKYPQ